MVVTGTEILISDFSKLMFREIPQNNVQRNQFTETDKDIQTLLRLGVIEKSARQEGEIISPVVLVKKADTSFCMILKFKAFNESVDHEHFL